MSDKDFKKYFDSFVQFRDKEIGNGLDSREFLCSIGVMYKNGNVKPGFKEIFNEEPKAGIPVHAKEAEKRVSEKRS